MSASAWTTRSGSIANEYIGRTFAAIYAAGLAAAKGGLVMLMNYTELPGAAAARLLEWCGVTGHDDVRDRVLAVAQFDAKTPSLAFDATEVTGKPARNQMAIDCANGFVAPYYRQLELLRLF